MDRTGARAAAMKLIYEWEMGGDGGEETRQDLLEIQPDECERDYMEKLVSGIEEHVGEIDSVVSDFAVDWKIERISRVDLAIMRVAIYEIKYASQPAGVAVNEALELARTYSTPEAVPFINGVLGSFIRSLQ
mgnify:FL=1